MRSSALAGLCLLVACATRAQPYRFASPMLGAADVPDSELPAVESGRPGIGRPTFGRPSSGRPSIGQPDVRDRAITTAPIRVASAEAADAIAREPSAHAVVWSRLPAPHRAASARDPHALAPALAPVTIRRPEDLRALVGRRDSRDEFSVALGWARDLGAQVDAATGQALVAWAEAAGRDEAPTSEVTPGDLLVFDRTEGQPADLVAIAIARDARGVAEFAYLAGGVVRRGFVDVRHPSVRRDASGAILNTFMRAGKLWPPKGTHYLAGELLAHIIRAR